jgi:hypothetical protein
VSVPERVRRPAGTELVIMNAAPNKKVKPLRLRQSAMIQKQKNRLDKGSLISKKI